MLLRREAVEPTGIDEAVIDDEQFEVLMTALSGDDIMSGRTEQSSAH